MKRKSKPSPPRVIGARTLLDEAAPTAERIAQGPLQRDATYEFEPGSGGGEARRVAAKPLRDLNALASKRLARCPGLTPAQILAGSLLERDHEFGRLEPRMTAALNGIGGGRSSPEEMPLKILEARNRKQAALTALRQAGPDVLRVVESVVLGGVTVTKTGQSRYANRSAAKAWVSLALGVGLSLLEGHYRAVGRMA